MTSKTQKKFTIRAYNNLLQNKASIKRGGAWHPFFFPNVLFDFTSRRSDLTFVRFVENMSTFAQSESTITKYGCPALLRPVPQTRLEEPARRSASSLSIVCRWSQELKSLSLALNWIYRGNFQWNHDLLSSPPVKLSITATNTKSNISI